MLKIETLEKMMNDQDWQVRVAAIEVCEGLDKVPIKLLEKGMRDSSWFVRCIAMRACEGRDVPIELIEKGMRDSDPRVRKAAMNACEGRDVPVELIEKGLLDSDCNVRAAAMNACQGRDVPPNRTFEPPKKVYKKCVGGVIVVAHIPKDAHVRGHKGETCRASKAEIVDIIGDLYGERVGVSHYDPTVEYRVGDVVETKNFDLSIVPCSSGFHFLCTLREAENYAF